MARRCVICNRRVACVVVGDGSIGMTALLIGAPKRTRLVCAGRSHVALADACLCIERIAVSASSFQTPEPHHRYAWTQLSQRGHHQDAVAVGSLHRIAVPPADDRSGFWPSSRTIHDGIPRVRANAMPLSSRPQMDRGAQRSCIEYRCCLPCTVKCRERQLRSGNGEEMLSCCVSDVRLSRLARCLAGRRIHHRSEPMEGMCVGGEPKTNVVPFPAVETTKNASHPLRQVIRAGNNSGAAVRAGDGSV